MKIKLLNDIYQIRFCVLEYSDFFIIFFLLKSLVFRIKKIMIHFISVTILRSWKSLFVSDLIQTCWVFALMLLLLLSFWRNFSISTNLLGDWDAASHWVVRLSMEFVMVVIGNVVLIEIVVVLVITITYLIAYDVRIQFTDFQPIMWKLTRMMELGHQFQTFIIVWNMHVGFLFRLILFQRIQFGVGQRKMTTTRSCQSICWNGHRFGCICSVLNHICGERRRTGEKTNEMRKRQSLCEIQF